LPAHHNDVPAALRRNAIGAAAAINDNNKQEGSVDNVARVAEEIPAKSEAVAENRAASEAANAAAHEMAGAAASGVPAESKAETAKAAPGEAAAKSRAAAKTAPLATKALAGVAAAPGEAEARSAGEQTSHNLRVVPGMVVGRVDSATEAA